MQQENLLLGTFRTEHEMRWAFKGRWVKVYGQNRRRCRTSVATSAR